MRAKPIFLLASLIAIVASGCSLGSAISAAGEAVDLLHERYNAGEYDLMYDEADEALKKQVSRREFVDFATSIKEQFGQIVDSERTNYSANTFKGTVSYTRVSSAYDVTFENGSKTEEFVWNIIDDTAYLMTWNINLSPLSP